MERRAFSKVTCKVKKARKVWICAAATQHKRERFMERREGSLGLTFLFVVDHPLSADAPPEHQRRDLPHRGLAPQLNDVFDRDAGTIS